MIPHPPSLKRCVLPVIGEYQKALTVSMVNHVLPQDVNVGYIYGTHWFCRLSEPTSIQSAMSATANAGGKMPNTSLFLLNGQKWHTSGFVATSQTAFTFIVVSSPTSSTQVNCC